MKQATAGLALSSSAALPLPAIAADGLKNEICTFTKPLQHLSYQDLAKEMAMIGFDGIEAPIRPKGHFEPEQVDDELPLMVEALKNDGLNLTILTSGINEVSDEQRTEAVLKTAADLGVKRFRMAYYKYDLDEPIAPQLDEFRAKLKDLVALTDELGIKPIYQNHSGKNYFGGPLWDLAEVLDDYSPEQIGVAFDIGHATVEGAKAWPLNYARIKSHIDTIYVKEPSWNDNKLSWGPLGEGVVDKGFFKLIQQETFSGPISLHVEYLGHSDPSIGPAVLEAMKTNLDVLKANLI